MPSFYFHLSRMLLNAGSSPAAAINSCCERRSFAPSHPWIFLQKSTKIIPIFCGNIMIFCRPWNGNICEGEQLIDLCCERWGLAWSTPPTHPPPEILSAKEVKTHFGWQDCWSNIFPKFWNIFRKVCFVRWSLVLIYYFPPYSLGLYGFWRIFVK